MIELPSILKTASEGNAEELWEQLRAKSLSSLFFFSKVILGYSKLTSPLHTWFCELLQEEEEIRKRGYLLPRGTFKSTIAGKTYPLWRYLRNHNFRTLIIGASLNVACKDLRDPMWHIQNNEVFRWLFPEAIPANVNQTTWNASEILLPRDQSFDEGTISCIGVGTRKTGFHYDLLLYEDIIGEEAYDSQLVMDSAWDWMQFAPGMLHDPASSEEVIIGTRWRHGVGDIYGRLIEDHPADRTESGRAIGFTFHTRSIIEEEGSIFPERFPPEVIEEIRKREGPLKFSCNYMNDPIAPGATDFESSKIKSYKISEDLKTLIPQDGTNPVRLARLYRIQVLDPAPGGQQAKSKGASVVTGEDSSGRLFVLGLWERKSQKGTGIGDGLEQMHVFNDKFKLYKGYYEDVAAQSAIEDIERERKLNRECRRCKKEHSPLRLEPVKAQVKQMSKEERVRDYLDSRINDGMLYLQVGHAKLLKQLIEFPNGDSYDLLDALAYCSHLSRRPISEEELEHEKELLEKAQQPRSQRCDTEFNYGGYV